MTPTLSDELRALGHLKDLRDAAKKIFEALDREHKRHQFDCMQRGDDELGEGWSMRVDGYPYSRKMPTAYGTVQDRKKFVAWALENQPDLVEYKERGEQLNAFVRRHLDNGEPLPEGLGFYEREHIAIGQGKS